jgi:hypothetical protein
MWLYRRFIEVSTQGEHAACVGESGWKEKL